MMSSPTTSSSKSHRRAASNDYVHVVGARRSSLSSQSSRTGRTPSEIMAGITGSSKKGHAWVDWDKNTRSANYRGSGSFATFMIIGPTCFFLGILFAMFPYDFPLLWTSDPVPDAYYDQLETHLKFMHSAPPLIARLLNIMVFVCFMGFFIKLYHPSEANVLFDGAGLVLFFIGVGIYITNITKGLRAASMGVWNAGEFQGTAHSGPVTGEIVLDRNDSLKVLAASNTILALVLVGVLVLQSGQWYAETKEIEELEAIEEEAMKGKKKQ
ncbi:ER membrane protein SH3 [Zalerion maritima]|uniref:ER membrane protein SH3 n=1 Tax=Zalerion maritima TaxID=339359 RepID=A0AAD5RMT4_9PEZI|nr:ER membrane protein SH3 [Zalerion maritima]